MSDKMDTIKINELEIPVMGDIIGVFVTANDVLVDNLLNKFDVYVQSWDGIFKINFVNSDFTASVSSVGGFVHSVSLHANRQLIAIPKI